MGYIDMNLGSGGSKMHSFIKDQIISKLKNGILERLDDSAVLKNQKNSRLAMTTDSYVVSPLFFAGGDIGRLAVSGTINDLSTSGARPYAMSLSFILEEGVDKESIEKIIDSIAQAADEAHVKIVTGDTKVVERGKGDKIYINTCGIGFIDDDIHISTYNAQEDDAVFITGTIGDHEITLVKERKMVDFDLDIESDAAPLSVPLQNLLESTNKINVVKDPTRGGVASALIEICEHSNVSIKLEEELLPIKDQVRSVCELVGFDPLYLANEGKFIIVAPANKAQHIRQAFPESEMIGKVIKEERPRLLLETSLGGLRRVGMMETTQLPRIC